MLSSAGQASFDKVLVDGVVVFAGELIAKVGEAYVPFDPDASDGSEKPVGVAFGNCDASASAQYLSLLVRDAEINAACLGWPDGMSEEEKSAALGWLATNAGLTARGLASTPPDAEPEGYEGPLDLTPGAVVAYGVRALSAAWLGENLFRLRRDSDDAELDFAADAETGEAPIAAIATWLDGAGGFVATWYDQSGNAKDLVQSDPELQGDYEAEFSNVKPCVSFAGSGDFMATAANVTLNGTNTVFLVHSRRESSGTAVGLETATDYWAVAFLSGIETTGNFNLDVYQDSTGNDCGGSFQPATPPQSTPHIVDAAWQFGGASLRQDGVAATLLGSNDFVGNPGDITEKLAIAASSASPSNTLAVKLAEVIIYSDLDADRAAVRQNQGSYYGIALA